MLVELAVRDLGVIAEARIPLPEGMTALTGETGTGKTLLVEALRLLCGQKGDPGRVRAGADVAVVEGLFAVGDTEWVLRRVVPASGRSRCYVNDELVPATRLAELSAEMVEIHGQHAHQSLLERRHHRSALDRFAGIDRQPLDRARSTVAALESELDELGGDERARQREIDLLEHQVAEIEAVGPRAGEDEDLGVEEDLLAGAVAYREAAAESAEMLGGDGAAGDLVARARAALGEVGPFAQLATRLAGLDVELADCRAELRSLSESIEPDEERLARVRSRRQSLVELRRKYGETIEDVLEFARRASGELDRLRGLDERRAELAGRTRDARAVLDAAAHDIGSARRAAAPRLAEALTAQLGALALGGSLMEVVVEDGDDLPRAGEMVQFLLAANAGQPTGPLARVASGGELSRVMLALRLVLTGGPPTMVFDEVDAGVGGAAAGAVAAALAELSDRRQVIVVTHLAQVAAAAGSQVAVDKRFDGAATATDVRLVVDRERVAEISRMLSGSPDSDTARRHAEELLDRTVETAS